MGEAYGTVVAILIGVYLMFIAPVNNMIYENQKLEQMYIVNEITYFTESVRNTGNISEELYLALKNKITSLNNKYNISVTHYSNVYNEDEDRMDFFGEAEYQWKIEDELEANKVYTLEKDDYIKVVVEGKNGVVACYGGSVKNKNRGL